MSKLVNVRREPRPTPIKDVTIHCNSLQKDKLIVNGSSREVIFTMERERAYSPQIATITVCASYEDAREFFQAGLDFIAECEARARVLQTD